MKITKVKLCNEDACYCMGSIECKQLDETFKEKLERAYMNTSKENESLTCKNSFYEALVLT